MIRSPRFPSWMPAVLALALVLRGLFPAGYMPGAGGAVQLCPHGLPAAALLFDGHDHDHHHHGNHHAAAAADPTLSTPGVLNGQDFERCSLGEALTLLALIDAKSAATLSPVSGPAPIAGHRSDSSTTPLQVRARSPPVRAAMRST